MAVTFFNTLTRTLEPFVPLDPQGKRVGIYCCGPTVYDYGHIGNFRTFVFADLVRRYLQFRGYEVRYVMNITDVEDKIIARVAQANKTLREYVSIYEAAFQNDMRLLSCLAPEQMPRATEHILEIIALIERLLAQGFAYRSSDGSIYFSIEKYQAAGHRYGQLVNLNFEEMRPGTRVASDEYAKESLADFALWKARVPADGQVTWPSPWGEGRPGWHIECSAMSIRYLGPSFDLHLGGEDLMFPHHEDEIAQSEGAALQEPGHPFVKYWLHGAHLLVEGKKMSKSLGNFYVLNDLIQRGFSGREIRCLLLKGHYRETFNFTLGGLDEARKSLARIDECITRLTELAQPSLETAPAEGLLRDFTEVMDADLNISGAWGVVFEWVRETNRLLALNEVSAPAAGAALAAWRKIDSVLGMGTAGEAEAPAEFNDLLTQREAARKARDFKRADALRAELKEKGWVIEDTPKGSRLKRSGGTT